VLGFRTERGGYTSTLVHQILAISEVQVVVIDCHVCFVLAENHGVKVLNALVTNQYWPSDCSGDVLLRVQTIYVAARVALPEVRA
jgi:hypothetical protein